MAAGKADAEALLESAEEALSDEPEQRTGLRRRATWAAAAAFAACAGAAVLFAAARAGGSGPQVARVQGFAELDEDVSAECSAHTDCAALSGNCCPTDGGAMLGCCGSPVVEASPAAEQCADTEGWTNGYSECAAKGYTLQQGCTTNGLTCQGYEALGLCANGSVVEGKEWASGEKLNFPELNCCACGKPAHPGAAPVNNTQGEPSTADCSKYANCASLGIDGHCCPTDAGLMLGCCSELGAAGPPPLLPAAAGPGQLMTFYMYRVANDEDYPINNVNMANLAGDMWYLHNEVVQHCPRKFNMERLLRFKVTMRATAELLGQGRNFDAFVAMDQAKCTVPLCTEKHWDPFGYVVGCQPNNVGQVAVPGSPVWYSLPGTCPSKFYFEKTEACNEAEPGGACPTSDVTGTRTCTYFLERAGEIRLDELSGIKDYNTVCSQTGQREYDVFSDMGVGTKFWNGKTDAAAGATRVQAIADIFAKKYPDMPATLDDPVCDVQG